MQETPVLFLGWKIPWRRDRLPTPVFLGFPYGSAGKESTCNAGDLGSVPGLGRSPGDREGCPLQYSDLENSMDCVFHGVTKSRIQLSDFHFHQLPGCGPLWVHGLWGTGPYSRKWAVGQRAKLHLPSPTAPHHSPYHPNHPLIAPITAWTTLTLVYGKIVFHKTGPQPKRLGLLPCMMSRVLLLLLKCCTTK